MDSSEESFPSCLDESSRRESEWEKSLMVPPKIIYRIGVYGWRKRCLYFSIVFLLCLSLLNFTLLMWIVRVMELTPSGISNLKIFNWGIKLEGDCLFEKKLQTSRIKPSDPKKPLKIDSAKQVVIISRNEDGEIQNKLTIGDDSIRVQAKNFIVENLNNKTLYQANSSDVVFGAESLEVTGDLGAVFRKALRTSKLTSDENLSIKSDGFTHLNAKENIRIQSSGKIQIRAQGDISMISGNQINLQAKEVIFKNLTISPFYPSGRPNAKVLQLCMCGNNGKLFLAHGSAKCQAFESTCS
ncbi:DgyrCDS4440 [Dimorphilus gyrociliatus]|uniref:DgyrCDS4440 n=1 Tax=Dimorphilus gyrociliatus TaxID=2664684 RepID=A0A7I8VH19_9ANNE|nr:DgyrCDS4440 [Dimorphilus gyrociliatus]